MVFLNFLLVDELLKLNAVVSRLNNDNIVAYVDGDLNFQLLNTIKVPIKLHYLTDMLPEANYDPLETRNSCNVELGGSEDSRRNKRIAEKELSQEPSKSQCDHKPGNTSYQALKEAREN